MSFLLNGDFPCGHASCECVQQPTLVFCLAGGAIVVANVDAFVSTRAFLVENMGMQHLDCPPR